MAFIHVFRTISFATLLLFSLIVLGIAARFLSLLADPYSGLALAVSVLTWVFILPIFLVGILRRGSFLSWVSVELGVCGFLWVLWLASASYTTSLTAGLLFGCGLSVFCQQYQAAQAFSWLNWLILFAYVVVLFVHAIRANGQGRSVWTSDVGDLAGTGINPVPPAKPEQANNVVLQPPMQQNYGVQPPYGHPGTPAV